MEEQDRKWIDKELAKLWASITILCVIGVVIIIKSFL